ncbi:BspA family leucine-rich repeat surface protein [Xylocopilactobacillus apicola]|uniref:Surface protein n=1 Tax=Xylocopilactobacillus apicola TaxID=2932184 RepID=A0AAU9CWY0_9LACO|nr:BspA family leucine-rich repeat surface protein [Xylocopilactobacillus apicola]BDR58492.1 hypothetical protein XA3_09330 [Xylocopilactobacillus apicola]
MVAISGGGQLANSSRSAFVEPGSLIKPRSGLSPINVGLGDTQNFFATVGTAVSKVNDNGTWDTIQINEAKSYQVGAVTLNSTLDMTKDFNFSWDLKIEPPTWTFLCDGIGFVLHPLYKSGERIIDSKGSPDYILPLVFGRHSDNSSVTLSDDVDNGQNIHSLGYSGGNLGISDLMNAIGFKVDTYNDDSSIVGINYIHGTPYGSQSHSLTQVLDIDDVFAYGSPWNVNNTYGAFVTTDSNGYAGKAQYSAPLNGMSVTPKNDAFGSVSGKPLNIPDYNWHPMSMSYNASTYTLQVVVGDPAIGGSVWTKTFNSLERAVIADRSNWAFSILGTTGQGTESNTIRNVRGSYTPGDPVITTRYVDENGNDLQAAKSTILSDWQIQHPGSTQFIDTSSPLTIVKNGKTYRRAQVNGTFFDNGTRINKRLGTPGSGGTVTTSGNTVTVGTEFNGVTFVNYVYRQDLPTGSADISADLQLSVNSGTFSKVATIRPGDNVIFKYTAKNNVIPIWSKVTAVQSLGGLFTTVGTLPADVIQKNGFLYIPLKLGTTNDLKLGETGTNTITMKYNGWNNAQLTANDAGQITITSSPASPSAAPLSKIVTKVAIYDQSSQLIDENGDPFFGSYFYSASNNKSPLASTDLVYNTGNYAPATDAVTLNDQGWWYLDPITKVLTIYPHELNGSVDTTGASVWPWHGQAADITKVVIKPGVTARGSLHNLFADLMNATSIEGLDALNTANVTDMNAMFAHCQKVTSLDVSHFNTTNVTDMNSMFNDCNLLTSLNLSSFVTNQVTSMRGMFQACTGITELDLNSFNTSLVQDFSYMFNEMHGLKKLNVTSFNTSSATDMTVMFAHMSVLPSLDLSSFNTSSVTTMTSMFDGSSKLWQLTLGSTSKLAADCGLTDPAVETEIVDAGTTYYVTNPNWREVGVGGTAHDPKETAKTAAQIISDSATATGTRIYVWDQIGKQALATTGNIDFGVHRGSLREHNHSSSVQNFNITDNRNSRNGKVWRVEAAVTKQFELASDATKKISGNPLYFQNNGLTTNLTSTAQTVYNGTAGSGYQDALAIPWSLSFKAHSNDIPAPGQYKATVTYTLVNVP